MVATLIPKYWCGAPLSILIKNSLQDNEWFVPTNTGSKRLSVTNFREFYEKKILEDFGITENFANSAEIDVFAIKNDICLCIEIKTRMYARIRAETNDYQIPYNSLHSRYHFDRYPEAVTALLELKEKPALADDRHETIRSSCELLRYCLGLVQEGYTSKTCLIVVLMPFYAKGAEFKIVRECLNRLRNYVFEEHNFNIPMAIWKVSTDSLNHEVPQNIWIEAIHQQSGFNIHPPAVTYRHIQNSLSHWRTNRNWKKCSECKYRTMCAEQRGQGEEGSKAVKNIQQRARPSCRPSTRRFRH